MTASDNQSSVCKGCLDSKDDCKACFPCELITETLVDLESGALCIKKGEGWMSTFTPALMYLIRSNTDVMSLMSGTAVKAVVAYVTDYITKAGLKIYSVFDVIQDVFLRNSDLLGDTSRQDKSHMLLIKMINTLTP